MATPITFGIYKTDPTLGLLPDDLATPSFVALVDKAGAARTRPGGGAGTIDSLGGGQFGFLPTDDDENTGVMYVVDCGLTALPRYVYGEISTQSNPFIAVVVFDDTGALSSGLPTVPSYLDFSSNDRTAPTPTIAGALSYLYSLTPTSDDLTVGVSGRYDLPDGKIPASANFAFYARDLGTSSGPPTTTLIADPGSDPFAALVVDVDDDVALRRVVLVATWEGLTRADAVFDGDDFGRDYATSTREPTLAGYRFTVKRNGGWPPGQRTRMNVIPIDTDGNEGT